jgi:hypothetical protein
MSITNPLYDSVGTDDTPNLFEFLLEKYMAARKAAPTGGGDNDLAKLYNEQFIGFANAYLKGNRPVMFNVITENTQIILEDGTRLLVAPASSAGDGTMQANNDAVMVSGSPNGIGVDMTRERHGQNKTKATGDKPATKNSMGGI